MSESLRAQIMAAISEAGDKATRVMLTIMLNLADSSSDTRQAVGELSEKVDTLTDEFRQHAGSEEQWRAAAFHNVPPERHADHHYHVAGEMKRRAEDREMMKEAKKGAAGKVGELAIEAAKWVLLLAAGGYLTRYLG